MLQLDDMVRRLNEPAFRNKALADVGEWVAGTCLLVGASPATAYQVAATFVVGLENGEQPKERTVRRKRSRKTD